MDRHGYQALCASRKAGGAAWRKLQTVRRQESEHHGKRAPLSEAAGGDQRRSVSKDAQSVGSGAKGALAWICSSKTSAGRLRRLTIATLSSGARVGVRRQSLEKNWLTTMRNPLAHSCGELPLRIAYKRLLCMGSTIRARARAVVCTHRVDAPASPASRAMHVVRIDSFCTVSAWRGSA